MQNNGLKKKKRKPVASLPSRVSYVLLAQMGFPAQLLSFCRGPTIHAVPSAQQQ